MKTLKAVALAAAIAMPAAAHAEIVASNPFGVMNAMQNFGMLATLATDNDGDPKIESRVSQSKFSVFFYGCDDNASNCTSIQFSAGYDLTDGITFERANEWNRQKRYAKVFVDDELDPFLRMDVNLDFDGVGDENFEDSLDLWRLLVEDFEEFIDW